MTGKSEAELEFKVTDNGFKEKIEEYKNALKQNRQELKLSQEQMKENATAQEKMETELKSLQERYEVQGKVVHETSERLKNAKQFYGENSKEVKNLESKLRSAQIYEQKLANQVSQTSKELQRSKGEIVTYSDKIESLEKREKNLTEQSKLVDAEFRRFQVTTHKSKDSYEQLSHAQERLGKQSEITKQKMELMREKLVLTEKEYGKNSTEALKLKTDLSKLESEFGKTKKEADLLVGVNLNKLTGKIDTARVKALSNAFKKVGDKMHEVGSNASMYISTPIVAAMGTSVKAAAEYREEVADIQKEVEAQGYSQKEVNSIMEDFGNKSLQWAQQFGVSTQSVNDGMFELVSNGYNVKQAMGMMPQLLKTMTANGDKTGTSLKLTSSMLEQFGQNLGSNNEIIKNGNTIMGQMTEATHKSAMSLDDLQTISSNAGSAMHGMGVSTSDFLSIAGKLRSAGIDASSVGTGLSSMMTKLAAPTSEASKLLKQYNVNVVDSHGKMRNMYDILGDMQGAYKKMGDAEKANFLKQTIGQENMKTGTTLMGAELSKYRELSSEIKNSTGTVDKYYKTMSNTPEAKMRRFKESVHALQVAVGEQLMPALTPLIDFFTKLIQKFSKLSPHTQRTIIIIAGVVAAIGPLLLGLGAVFSSFSKIDKGIGALSKGFSLLKGASGIAGVIGAMGPFIPVILAVIAVIGAAIIIFKNWDKIVKFFKKTFASLSPHFRGVMNKIKSIFSSPIFAPLVNGIKQAANAVKTIFSGLVQIFTGIFNIIKGVFTGNGEAIKQGMSQVFHGIVSIIQGILNGLIGIVAGELGTMVNVAISVIKKLIQSVPGILHSVADFFSNIFGSIIDIVSNIFGRVVDAITHPMNTAKNAVSNIIEAIKGFFSFSISWPNIPLPHFSVNPPGWSIGDLLKGDIPSLGIDWYAKGGLFNGPHVIGVGEAGQEAVLPLTNPSVMGTIAKTIAEYTPKELTKSNTTIQNNFQIDIHGDVDSELRARRMTEEITNRITQKFNQSKQAFS